MATNNKSLSDGIATASFIGCLFISAINEYAIGNVIGFWHIMLIILFAAFLVLDLLFIGK